MKFIALSSAVLALLPAALAAPTLTGPNAGNGTDGEPRPFYVEARQAGGQPSKPLDAQNGFVKLAQPTDGSSMFRLAGDQLYVARSAERTVYVEKLGGQVMYTQQNDKQPSKSELGGWSLSGNATDQRLTRKGTEFYSVRGAGQLFTIGPEGGSPVELAVVWAPAGGPHGRVSS